MIFDEITAEETVTSSYFGTRTAKAWSKRMKMWILMMTLIVVFIFFDSLRKKEITGSQLIHNVYYTVCKINSDWSQDYLFIPLKISIL